MSERRSLDTTSSPNRIDVSPTSSYGSDIYLDGDEGSVYIPTLRVRLRRHGVSKSQNKYLQEPLINAYPTICSPQYRSVEHDVDRCSCARGYKFSRNRWREMCVFQFLLQMISIGAYHHSHDNQPNLNSIVDIFIRTSSGVRLRDWGLEMKHPVILQPGFVTTGLEFWKTAPCATGMFRKRLWGRTDMQQSVLRDPACWIKHMQLNARTGLDNPDWFVRPAEGLEAADEFIAGFWIWTIVIEELNAIGYDSNSQTIVPYDWRLGYAALDIRDRFFEKLESSVERYYRNNRNTKVVIAMHSMAGLVWHYFQNRQEALRPGWVEMYIHAAVHIGSPHQGVAKSQTSQMSGEMRDTAELGPWVTYLKQLFLGNIDVTAIFRNMHSVMSMGMKGGSAIWGNNTHPIDSYEAVKKWSCEGCSNYMDQMWQDYGFVEEASISMQPEKLPLWLEGFQRSVRTATAVIHKFVETRVLQAPISNPWILGMQEICSHAFDVMVDQSAQIHHNIRFLFVETGRIGYDYGKVLRIFWRCLTRPIRKTQQQSKITLETQQQQGLFDQAVLLKDRLIFNVGNLFAPGLQQDMARIGQSQAYVTLTEKYIQDPYWAQLNETSKHIVKNTAHKKFKRPHITPNYRNVTDMQVHNFGNITNWHLAMNGGELSENARNAMVERVSSELICELNNICNVCRENPVLPICKSCACVEGANSTLEYQYSIEDSFYLFNQTESKHHQKVSGYFSQGLMQLDGSACPGNLTHRFPAYVYNGVEQGYICEHEANKSGYSDVQMYLSNNKTCPAVYTHMFTLGSSVLDAYGKHCDTTKTNDHDTVVSHSSSCSNPTTCNQPSSSHSLTLPPILLPIFSNTSVIYPSNATVPLVGTVIGDKSATSLNEHTQFFFPRSHNPHISFLEAQRLWANPLASPLANAPSMTIYNLYGVGKPTERRFFYRINPSDSERVYIPFLLDSRVHDPSGQHISNGIGYVDGDGTVPLMSLGYMCAANGAWDYKPLNPSNIPCINREYKRAKNKLAGAVKDILRTDASSIDHIDIMGNSKMISDLIFIVGKVNLTRYHEKETFEKTKILQRNPMLQPELVQEELETLFGGPPPQDNGLINLRSREYSCIQNMAKEIELHMPKHAHRRMQPVLENHVTPPQTDLW